MNHCFVILIVVLMICPLIQTTVVPLINEKPLWHSAKDSDIEAYKGTLDNYLSLYSLNVCILNSTMPCSCIVPHIDLYIAFMTTLLNHVKLLGLFIFRTQIVVFVNQRLFLVGIIGLVVHVKNLY